MCALFRLPGERSNLVASNLLFQFSGLQSSLQGATAAAGNVIVLQPTKTAMDSGRRTCLRFEFIPFQQFNFVNGNRLSPEPACRL